MKNKADVTVKYLKDYQATPYTIDHIDLAFDIYPDHTDVHSDLSIRRITKGKAPLVLDGVDLELLSLKFDDRPMKSGEYVQDDRSLRLLNEQLPESFHLQLITRIYPHTNTSLEGLYQSAGNFCTQCEAEGFRKITFYYDRPDVMATFTTMITADQKRYPVLLANGNCVERGNAPQGRHFVKWIDPFKKPCYLFALVAGDYQRLSDRFVTRSGRPITLEIYASAQDISKCHFAMDSLKKSMSWDESVYGLECDLDHYMIVATGDFNMGAMENKGLNIFNTSCVLAEESSSTDRDFAQVEAVIAHEYFHNWTGNRVTCRDWFQLCLKEGLTVFRDQEFSADLGSRSVCRIDQVSFLRDFQFPEDGGPMAHPVRPDRFVQINNFYTTTIYEKGAELIRMIQSIIGREAYFRGIKAYFARHDGQAITIEDFLAAMAVGAGRDLSDLLLWYQQSGTPEVHVEGSYDHQSKTYQLKMRQVNKPTADQKSKRPLPIPVFLGLLGRDGKDLSLKCDDPDFDSQKSMVLLQDQEKVYQFRDVSEIPVPSLMRHFSAPVKLKANLSQKDLEFLMAKDSDDFNRWDAGQELYGRALLKMVKDCQQGHPVAINPGLLQAVGAVLVDQSIDFGFKAKALTLPADVTLSQQMECVDVDALYKARLELKRGIALSYKESLLECYHELNHGNHFAYSRELAIRRSLKNLALSYLASLGDSDSQDLLRQQWQSAKNMTDMQASLGLMVDHGHPDRDSALISFYEKWKHEALVIDQWFRLQALSSAEDTSKRVLRLAKHPGFVLSNPNRVRSLLVAFCKNIIRFHDQNGEGYQFYGDNVLALDRLNPQMAARLARSLSDWHRYDQSRQKMMVAQLVRIREEKNLSNDVREIVGSLLK